MEREMKSNDETNLHMREERGMSVTGDEEELYSRVHTSERAGDVAVTRRRRGRRKSSRAASCRRCRRRRVRRLQRLQWLQWLQWLQ